MSSVEEKLNNKLIDLCRVFNSEDSEHHLLLIDNVLKEGADINCCVEIDGSPFTPLFIAVVSGNPKLVEFFLDKGAEVNRVFSWPGYGELTCLYFAAIVKMNAEIVRLLLRHGALTDRDKHILVSAVLRSLKAEIVSLLLDYGAVMSEAYMIVCCSLLVV